MSNHTVPANQLISLPQGGGALSNIGETFSPDLHTGTGNFTIPIALPPGRNSFQPQLNLVYSTGSGASCFGLGWRLSIPSILRKTSQGVPRYLSEHDPIGKPDTFILSGAEDLVPTDRTDAITRYRPRTEGLFAHIEHHHSPITDHWQVRSKDGLVSTYGTAQSAASDPAVIADPVDRSKIFGWKLTQTIDTFGNRCLYEYERDLEETAEHLSDQVYLNRIKYVDYDGDQIDNFLITVSFVYEERPDVFSDYRAGFEIRTRKRCTQIKVRTHASVEDLVRTYHLIYMDQLDLTHEQLPLNAASLLMRVVVEGHNGELSETLPPLEFGYTTFEPTERCYQAISAAANFMPERSLADGAYELVDLFGNGLPSVIHMKDVVCYWRNLGDGQFDLPRTMAAAPANVHLTDSGVQLADTTGDGRVDLLVLDGTLIGYYPLSFQGSWDECGFRRYSHAPTINLDAPDTRLIDLDGDGVTDALRTGSSFELYYSHPDHGWTEVETRTRVNTDTFPNVDFSDPRVKLGDMNGDGLQDIVLFHHGCTEYWPYRGYGRWGKRTTMRNSPEFDDDRYFPGIGYDPKRLLLGDVDGDGLADLVYVSSGFISVWINQSGNAWSDPVVIYGTPLITDADSVRLVDLLGTGTDGILWTYDFATFSDSTYKFLDLTGGLKPYLLKQMDNQMGVVTKVAYAPSTQFYLQDEQQPETRWKTPLPFPVQVVARVEMIDHFSHCKLTTEYRYHQGYWDGTEREYRGFGMVEQQDTQTAADYGATGMLETQFEAVADAHVSPPLLTKTWFHQGPVDNGSDDWQELDWSAEYWPGDPSILDHTQAVNDFLNRLQEPRAKRDALRALSGSVLRTELYALDNSERQDRPYTVSEYVYGLREESPPDVIDSKRPHIFFPFALAQRTTQWERGSEPMTQFSFTTDYDEYGLSGSQTALAVPRGRDFRTTAPPGEPYLGTHSVTRYARRDDPTTYIVDRTAAVSIFEIVNDGSQPLIELLRLLRANQASLELFAQSFNYFDGDAFLGLPLGQLGDFGAVVRTETLMMTESILAAAYRDEKEPVPQDKPPYLTSAPAWTDDYPLAFRNTIPPMAGYKFADGTDHRTRGYFVEDARLAYDFQISGAISRRGLSLIMRDPLGRDTFVQYDAFQLMPVQVTDAAGLVMTAEYDYRVMQASKATDPNGNHSRFTFSPLGLLQEIFVQGKRDNEGDKVRPSAQFAYDFQAFSERQQPVGVRTIRREHHDTETNLTPSEREAIIETVEYSDGFGRLIQTRTQAEDVIWGNGEQPLFGDGVLSDNPSALADPIIGRNAGELPNVVVSGWQVYDNKGHVIAKFEPFFSTDFDYLSPEQELEQTGRDVLGQKVTMFYDPRGQIIRTVNPDGSEQGVIFGVPLDLTDPERFTPTPWEAYTYDLNDNAARTHAQEAQGYQHHWNTPASIVVDALGRIVLSITRNRAASDPIEEIRTRSAYDIRGNLLEVFDAQERLAFIYVYDLANNPLRINSLDAGVRRTMLNAVGSEIERRDSKGSLILQSYDLLNRPRFMWARDEASASVTLREVVEYGDASSAQQNPAEREANRQLNRLGRIHRNYDEAGRVVIEAYDFKGNILDKTRQVIADNELLSIFAAPDDLTTPLTYRVNWQSGQSLEARAAVLLDPLPYRMSMAYDALNRVTQVTYPQDQDGERKTLRPQYNRAGALEQVELAGQGGVTTYVAHIAYNAKGQRTLIALGNGVMTRYAYEAQTFRLIHLRSEGYTQPDANTLQPGGVLLQDFIYDYDLAGNILRITDRVPGCGVRNNPEAMLEDDAALRALVAAGNALVRRFDYDAIYQLTSATGRESRTINRSEPWLDDSQRCGLNAINHATPNQANAPNLTATYSETYAYDSVGNLTSLRHNGQGGNFTRRFGLTPNTNRLRTLTIGQTEFAYRYDANGNLIDESLSRHFEWDHSDRMKAFRVQVDNAEPSMHVQYLYDAGGMRVKKLIRRQGGSVESTTYIDDLFEHHRWGAGQQNNHLHVMDDQQRIAVVRVGLPHPDDRGPAVQYHFGDHLNSSAVVADQNGGFVNREEYTPYGETSFGSFGRKRYRFNGKERDEESGLNYHAARYYAPWLARWISCDPAGTVDGLNLFSYARNGPISHTDPSGTDSKPKQSKPPVNASDVSDGADIVGGIQDRLLKYVVKTKQTLNGEAARKASIEAQRAARSAGKSKKAIKLAGREARAAEKAGATQLSKLAKGLKAAGKTLSMLGTSAAFFDKTFSDGSPAQTQFGKTSDAIGSIFLFALIVKFAPKGAPIPIVAALDAVQDKVFRGHKPVPISDTINGSVSGVITVVEASVTGSVLGLNTFHERSKAGEYGWLLRLASNVGELASEEWFTSDDVALFPRRWKLKYGVIPSDN